MIRSVASSDITIIKSSAIYAAKAESILDVPVVLLSINPQNNGEVFPEIISIFPNQDVFARKIPSLMLLKMKGPTTLLKRLIGIN